MNILIIGGNGFVGKHLVRHLIARKYRVTVLDIKKTSYLEKIAQKKINVFWSSKRYIYVL